MNHPWELHVSRLARDKYKLSDTLFSNDGKLVFGNYNAVRLLAHKMNKDRGPDTRVLSGQLNAAGILDEACHFILRAYEQEIGQAVFDKALEWLQKQLGSGVLDKVLSDFTTAFPPVTVYKGESSASDYLQGTTRGRTHASIVLEEALMLSLSRENPANQRLDVLFDTDELPDKLVFKKLVALLEEYFRGQPGFGSDGVDVVTFMKMPFLLMPGDIHAQMDYVLQHWKRWLPESMVQWVLKGKDLIREDIRMEGGGGGAAPTMVPQYKGKAGDGEATIGRSGYRLTEEAIRSYEEYEHFTPDTHWMPKVVLMAKNAYVWLDQLSSKYGRQISTLDQVPDQELDTMASWGFNGLWLIGIWERSNSSRRIKHLTGNPDAVSSAYSLYDYEIAGGLGGETAFEDLNHRTRERGIRLASDMVPNHTGLYSRWMVDHPDFFIQSRQSPFPAYRFTGENLSDHPDIEIRIEDGYYARSDAAVVFQRYDKRFDDLRYIYHGNDGTNMPWNDTAQLDMLKHEVRQAVIGKIMDVARRFSIIRFDAAMTLAKKHFSRLWYPRPGSGGDIPSRADHAMSQQEFDEMFPVEFWREVVDRMNAEMPDTLLLAEAFWLMEGYFVRTLGMHRVYNSAFMHMMKNGENAKYRDLISNTLEFEPEILKRYVNFMSNPDEETAIRQFGNGDKYFGACIMMATLPGLPMFAHGQIEGYTEKYGMEYQRAYYKETPDQALVDRHQREVFPLLKKRFLFSEVDHFFQFDFNSPSGEVNENVFAFSNRSGNEASLVLFNNAYEGAEGRLKTSTPRLTGSGDQRRTVEVGLGDAINLENDDQSYYLLTEQISRLEYIRKGSDLHRDGFSWKLRGFEYRVFLGFEKLAQESGMLERLYQKLGGHGTGSIARELDHLRLNNTYEAFAGIFEDLSLDEVALPKLIGHHMDFVGQACKDMNLPGDAGQAAETFGAMARAARKGILYCRKQMQPRRENLAILIASFALAALKESGPDSSELTELGWSPRMQWPLQQILQTSGKGEEGIRRDILLVGILSKYGPDLYTSPGQPAPEKLLSDPLVQEFLGVNQHQNVWYYSKEHFEELNHWFFSLASIECFMERKDRPPLTRHKIHNTIERYKELFDRLNAISVQSGYELEKLGDALLHAL
jgi:glycosidase